GRRETHREKRRIEGERRRADPAGGPKPPGPGLTVPGSSPFAGPARRAVGASPASFPLPLSPGAAAGWRKGGEGERKGNGHLAASVSRRPCYLPCPKVYSRGPPPHGPTSPHQKGVFP